MGLKESRQIGKIVIDPRNSDIVFVAAEGSVWGAGGDRGLYKTTDGGETWKKITKGLPSGHVGGMGLAISPVNPDVLYIIAEAEGETGGFFRSFKTGVNHGKK